MTAMLERRRALHLAEYVVRCTDEIRLRRVRQVVRRRYVDSGLRNGVLVAIALRARELRVALARPAGPHPTR